MIADDLALTLVGGLAAANTVDQPVGKGSGTVSADRLAQCPALVLCQGPLDVLLDPAMQGLEHTTRVLDSDAHILVTGDRIGDHVDQVGTVAAAFAGGFFSVHRIYYIRIRIYCQEIDCVFYDTIL